MIKYFVCILQFKAHIQKYAFENQLALQNKQAKKKKKKKKKKNITHRLFKCQVEVYSLLVPVEYFYFFRLLVDRQITNISSQAFEGLSALVTL
jgi:hypothetical protein